ncbi:hypothetical protein BaRGS_00033395 [Batillaria attramentaria]|uniref:PDZ domain-containing protein n=1 Tax=Batillaria attramentaria TaxID=370345 RepID=A0ABD0JKD0_9CAEN
MTDTVEVKPGTRASKDGNWTMHSVTTSRVLIDLSGGGTRPIHVAHSENREDRNMMHREKRADRHRNIVHRENIGNRSVDVRKNRSADSSPSRGYIVTEDVTIQSSVLFYYVLCFICNAVFAGSHPTGRRGGIHVIKIHSGGGASPRMGFSIRGGSEYGLGIYVSQVDPGSPAEKSGLRCGDQLLEANGVDLENATGPRAAELLGATLTPTLIVRRTRKVPEWKVTKERILWYDVASKKLVALPSGEVTSVKQPGAQPKEVVERRVTLKLTKKTDFVGLNVRGGKEYGLGIYVSRVDRGGLAQKAGICVGDQLVQVNEHHLDNVTHPQAVELLRSNKQLIITAWAIGRFPAYKELFSEYVWSDSGDRKENHRIHVAELHPEPVPPPRRKNAAKLTQRTRTKETRVDRASRSPRYDSGIALNGAYGREQSDSAALGSSEQREKISHNYRPKSVSGTVNSDSDSSDLDMDYTTFLERKMRRDEGKHVTTSSVVSSERNLDVTGGSNVTTVVRQIAVDNDVGHEPDVYRSDVYGVVRSPPTPEGGQDYQRQDYQRQDYKRHDPHTRQRHDYKAVDQQQRHDYKAVDQRQRHDYNAVDQQQRHGYNAVDQRQRHDYNAVDQQQRHGYNAVDQRQRHDYNAVDQQQRHGYNAVDQRQRHDYNAVDQQQRHRTGTADDNDIYAVVHKPPKSQQTQHSSSSVVVNKAGYPPPPELARLPSDEESSGSSQSESVATTPTLTSSKGLAPAEPTTLDLLSAEIKRLEERQSSLGTRELYRLGGPSDSTAKAFSMGSLRKKKGVFERTFGSQMMNQHTVDKYNMMMVEERARQLLNKDESGAVLKHIKAYHENKQLERLVELLLTILDRPEKLQLLKDIRGVIYPYDVGRFDSMVASHEVTAFEKLSTKLHLPLSPVHRQDSASKPRPKLMTTVLDADGHFHIKSVEQHDHETQMQSDVVTVLQQSKSKSFDTTPVTASNSSNNNSYPHFSSSDHNHYNSRQKVNPSPVHVVPPPIEWRDDIEVIIVEKDPVPPPPQPPPPQPAEEGITVYVSKQKKNLVCGGAGDHMDPSVRIDLVMPWGAAADDDRIQAGMHILSVDDQSLRGMTQSEAIAVLKRCFHDTRSVNMKLVLKNP